MPLAIACAGAGIVFFTAHLLESRYRTLLWLDAAALTIAVAAGVNVAMGMGQSAPIILVMGVATGTLGGLLRDVVCNEVPLVLKQGELYVTAAFAGAGAAILSATFLAHPVAPVLACIIVTFALRAGSLAFGWRLPVYRARPPRP